MRDGRRRPSEQAAKSANAQHHKVSVCVFVCTRTHIHGCDVILVGFPDLLHDLQLGPAAAFNGAFDCDGSLWVVQREVLKAARGQEGGERGSDTDTIIFFFCKIKATFLQAFPSNGLKCL